MAREVPVRRAFGVWRPNSDVAEEAEYACTLTEREWKCSLMIAMRVQARNSPTQPHRHSNTHRGQTVAAGGVGFDRMTGNTELVPAQFPIICEQLMTYVWRWQTILKSEKTECCRFSLMT